MLTLSHDLRPNIRPDSLGNVQAVLRPGDSVRICFTNFWTNIPDTPGYFWGQVTVGGQSDPTPANNIVTGPTCYSCGCSVSYQWFACNGLQVVTNLSLYPKDSAVLNHMRPGGTIAIYAYVLDFDTLLQRCTDHEGLKTDMWDGPYADQVMYEWTKDQTVPGTLLTPNLPLLERNAVLYQLPLTTGAAPFEVRISVKVGNSPNTPKAIDPTLTGTVRLEITPRIVGSDTTFMVVPHVDTMISAPVTCIENTFNAGQCKPANSWLPLSPLTLVYPQNWIMPDTTCGAVGLAYVGMEDFDQLVLTCKLKGCTSDTIVKRYDDPLTYIWSTGHGDVRYPLGAYGAVVPYVVGPTVDRNVAELHVQDSWTQARDFEAFISDTVNHCVQGSAAVIGAQIDRTFTVAVKDGRVLSVRYTTAMPERAVLTVIDILGTTQFEVRIPDIRQGENTFSFELPTLPKGTYFIRLQADGEVLTRKIGL